MWFEWWHIMIGLGLIVVGAVGCFTVLFWLFHRQFGPPWR